MKPLIASLLDTDYYKLTMGQVVFKKYGATPVKYAFTNRTASVNIADYIDEGRLRDELDAVMALRFQPEEIAYLANLKSNGQAVFEAPYLDFLGSLKLPPYRLEIQNGHVCLEFPGPWEQAIYWEIPALSIVNELYHQAVADRARESLDTAYEEGKQRLDEKIDRLKAHPGIRFADFGTRRRFSQTWQEGVLKRLKKEAPGQLTGSSNVDLARKLDLAPIGTFAHEMYMVMSGIMNGCNETIQKSHNVVLQDWWAQYGAGLSIALTDNYGTDFFFRDFSTEQAAKWRGIRQDSGDPVAFGEKAIAFYKRIGVDPKSKMIVFSDGLDIETMVRLFNHFHERIMVSFGWGTNLTNDLGHHPLSIVIKATESNGIPTVKLCDNLAKAIGRKEDIERFKRIFGYTDTFYEQCRY
jgi:nicotinate phosphoribosyltransferase